jgi:hypothetical protein
MDPNDTPPEVVEAIDEVFQEEPIPAPRMPAQPPRPEVQIAVPSPPEPQLLPQWEATGKVGDTTRPGSPFKDYVRELQQEFEDQQTNGEVLP